MRYRAFGEDRYTSGTTPTTYRYTGQRQESYINLYYYGARWYDPYIQRWISPDPIVPNPSDPQALNRYSYVLNNPLRYTDPSGHWTFEEDPESSTPVRTLTPPTDKERIALARAYRPSAPTMASPVAGESSPDISGPFGAFPTGDRYTAYKDKNGNPYCHPGLDYGVGVGTDLQATKDGIVVAAPLC